MQRALTTLVTTTQLKEILKHEKEFAENYRLLEACVGQDTKEAFNA